MGFWIDTQLVLGPEDLGLRLVKTGAVCVSWLESVPAVPCYRRCHQMAVLPENEKIIKLDQGDEEGWVDTHHGIGEGGRVEGDISEGRRCS